MTKERPTDRPADDDGRTDGLIRVVILPIITGDARGTEHNGREQAQEAR